jgi:hypothetical protein
MTPPPRFTATEREIRDEVLRVYDRYAQEVVEAFDLCPWAARSRRDGSAEPHVVLQSDPNDFGPSLRLIDELSPRKELSVALFIYPAFAFGRLDFEHFLRRFRHTDSERHEAGRIPFAMAAFHPQAPAVLADGERLIPFLRRSPDPTIQLVRREALEAVKGEGVGTGWAELWMVSTRGARAEPPPTIRQRIAQRNLETVRRVGAAAIEAVLADIDRDRNQTYARLGLPPRAH